MRIAVIYDFGMNKGGGDFVMLNILEALNSTGYEVSLLTSYPEGLDESAEHFSKRVPDINIHYVKAPIFLKHPYTIAYIARKINVSKSNSYDVYVVSDDIPRGVANKIGICYMHYPHTARFKFMEYVAVKYKATVRGKLTWMLHKILFPKFFLTGVLPENWSLIANSIVTRRHTAEVFGVNSDHIAPLNPPVSSQKIYSYWRNNSVEKEDMAVCIGRFEPEKKFMDVIYAAALLKNKLRLILIGFTHSEVELMRTIEAFGLKGNVELLVNADRKTIIDTLLRAKAIVHPMPREPFGIAVVEGMAAGCVPIVRKGFNGPWMEITREGQYGVGFSSIEELVSTLKMAIEHYESFNIGAIVSRALEFDETKFRHRFMKIFESFVNTCPS